MTNRAHLSRLRIMSLIFALAVCELISSASAQVRGVYPLGMTATNSGVTPEAGFTYTNQFLFYSRSELKDSTAGSPPPGKTPSSWT